MPEILITVRNKLPVISGDIKAIVTNNSDYTIRFEFDEQWDEGEKIVYLIHSNGFAYAPITTADDRIAVPIQHKAGLTTKILIGVQQGNIKTSRACAIAVYPAVTELIDDEAVQEDDELWNYVLLRLKDVEDAVTQESLSVIVADYFRENPIKETDPTVPDWAKEPEKPTYTADEVGAMSADTKIPKNTSDLKNDSGYITRTVSDLVNYYTKSQTYTRDEVQVLVSAIPKFAISVVSYLPTSNISTTTVYLVKSGTGSDMYTEYIYVNGVWEVLGSQRVDLTGYATETWVSIKLADYMRTEDLQTAVETALALAKASGEFDGVDGKTPIKGTDYFTPEEVEQIVDEAAGKAAELVEVEVDDTLTKAGQAADAKAVGDAVTQLFQAIAENGDNAKIQIASKGNLDLLKINGNEYFDLYYETEGGVSVTENVVTGTGWYECPKYLMFDFENQDARIIVYFATLENGEYVPRWDILNLTTSKGLKNYLSKSNTHNRVIEIPDGTYMRVRLAEAGDVKLYGWNGVHVGCEMSGTAYMIKNDTGGEVTYAYSLTGITIPGNATLLWCKTAAIRHLWGIKADGTKEKIFEGSFLQVYTLPEGYSYFRATLTLDYAEIPDSDVHGAETKATKPIDLNDVVSCLCEYTVIRPVGRAAKVIENARKLTEIEWVCKAEKATNGSELDKFTVGTKYTSIPYSSLWTEPHFFGWHISKHTFLNAANDEDSHFYKGAARTGRSTGYGSVCSAFATLADGWQYPVTTYGFLKDPQIEHHMVNDMPLGSVLYEGTGHTIIGDTKGHGDGWEQYTIYESVNPVALRRSGFSMIDDSSHNTRTYSYINPYIYSCHHKQANHHAELTGYDVENSAITNGKARPYYGDRSVCTSSTGVQINIKDDAATKCYYQKCTYDAKLREFTPVGNVSEQAFAAGTDQIDLIDAISKYGTAVSADASGITFAWDGTFCTVTGTSTSATFSKIITEPTGFVGLKAGKTYRLKFNTTDENVYLRFIPYIEGTAQTAINWNGNQDVDFTIDGSWTGGTLRLQITSGITVNGVVSVELYEKDLLDDGAFYAVWTDTDTTKEHFEYHAVSDMYYSETDDTIVPPDGEFWYMLWWQSDTASKKTEIIPYLTPNSDVTYADYRKVYKPNYNDGYIFFKGALGAYCTKLKYRVAE